MTKVLEKLGNLLGVGRLLPAYMLFGLLKHLVPLRLLARWVWCRPAGWRDRDVERRLQRRVIRLGQLVGLPDRDCLQRSLVLYRALSRAGADPMLVIGFDRMNGRIFGHAWVVVDGQAVIESETDLLRFSPVVAFGRQGVLVSPPPEVRAA
jgi:hypothetical protein